MYNNFVYPLIPAWFHFNERQFQEEPFHILDFLCNWTPASMYVFRVHHFDIFSLVLPRSLKEIFYESSVVLGGKIDRLKCAEM